MAEWLRAVAAEFLRSLGRMWWIVLLGIAVSAALKTWKLDKRLRAILDRAGGWGIPLAVAAGLVSPLCSCGILPVVVAMMAAQVPFPIVMSLLITSPLMSPDAFLITWRMLGPAFAWGKVISATAIGLAAGYTTRILWPGPMPLRATPPPSQGEHHCVDPNDTDDPRRGLELRGNRAGYFVLMVRDVGGLMVRLLLLALLLEAIIVASAPERLIEALLGAARPLAIPLAAVIGIPLPLHQVAAVPILYGLMNHGMDPGAAMTLLVAGPVTSIPALFLLSRVVDRKVVIVYAAAGLLGALASGYLFNLLAGR